MTTIEEELAEVDHVAATATLPKHYPTAEKLKQLLRSDFARRTCRHVNAEPMAFHALFACPDCRTVFARLAARQGTEERAE